MLALAFFISVFSSVTWLIYAALFIREKLAGLPLIDLSLFDASIYLAFLLLPVFVLWGVFGYINQYANNRNIGRSIYDLFKQMKKNLDYTDLVARIMLEAEQEIKDGFILNKFDVFISDMNEILSEIIKRSGIASVEQIDNLWAKVQNGGKWSFGKVLIEVFQSQSDFQLRMYNRAQKDKVLSGSVQEFCARYQALLTLLEKHDKEHVFLNLVETGVFGKIYSIFLPISDELVQGRENLTAKENQSAFTALSSVMNVSNAREASFSEPETFKALDRKNAFNQEKNQPQANNVQNDEKVKKTSSKFSLFKKKKKDYEVGEDSESEKDDPFTMALERSFGTEDPATFDKEPRFDAPIDTSSRSLSRSESDSSAFTFNSESSKVVSFVDAAAVNLPKSLKNNAKEPWHDEEQLDIEDFTGHPQEKNDNSENLSETVDFDDTRKSLKALRREWEKLKNSETKKESASKNFDEGQQQSSDDNRFSYPFGSWVNEVGSNK